MCEVQRRSEASAGRPPQEVLLLLLRRLLEPLLLARRVELRPALRGPAVGMVPRDARKHRLVRVGVAQDLAVPPQEERTPEAGVGRRGVQGP